MATYRGYLVNVERSHIGYLYKMKSNYTKISNRVYEIYVRVEWLWIQLK